MSLDKLLPYESTNEKILLEYYHEQRRKALRDEEKFTNHELAQLDLTRFECRAYGHMSDKDSKLKYLDEGRNKTRTIIKRNLYDTHPWLMVGGV